MAKGCFTQGCAVLLARHVTLDEVCRCLGGYTIVKRIEASHNPVFSGASAIVAYKPEVNGYVSIDIYPSSWPDRMGTRRLNLSCSALGEWDTLVRTPIPGDWDGHASRLGIGARLVRWRPGMFRWYGSA